METGVATQYDHRLIGEGVNQLCPEYALAKSDHPLSEQLLLTLTGEVGLTTEQRLSVDKEAKEKPESGGLTRDIEDSVPAGVENTAVLVCCIKTASDRSDPLNMHTTYCQASGAEELLHAVPLSCSYQLFSG